MISKTPLKNLIGSLISNPKKSFQFTDEPRFNQYTSFSQGNEGSGIDTDDAIAKLKAMGECVERACLATFKKKNFVKKSFNQLGKKGIDPTLFVNYCKLTKYKIERIRNEKFNWDTITDYFTKEKKFLPAQLIYVPYKANELTLRNPLSSGAACALSKKEAIYKGICELVERDAFMLTYLNKISVPKISLDIIKDEEIQKILKMFKRYFIEVNLFYLPSEFVPTVLCVLVDKSGYGPAISIGAKTDFDINLGIKGALLESQHTRLWIRYKLIQGRHASSKFQTLEDRGLYWAKLKSIPKLSFLLNSKKTLKTLPKRFTKNKLDKVLSAIKNKKYDLYVKDLTTPLVAKQGLFVWKTIIPQLHPLYLFEDLKYHYGDRIGKGIKNKIPHPFV